MKRLSHAKMRDINEPEIVAALRAVGAIVILQDGPVDLLVGYMGHTYLIEVKRPLGPQGGASSSCLTPDQIDFITSWQGGQVAVVRTRDEALAAIGVG